MINAVGRDIPEEILEMTGKEVFQGNHYRDGYVYKKDGPYTKCVVNNTQSKLVANIHDVLIKCGIKDGMTLGFHHHFRDLSGADQSAKTPDCGRTDHCTGRDHSGSGFGDYPGNVHQNRYRCFDYHT